MGHKSSLSFKLFFDRLIPYSFCHDIRHVLPVDLLLPEAPSSDALLRCCILAHQTATTRGAFDVVALQKLQLLLQINLGRLSASPASVERVLALLILSLAPLSATESSTHVSPDRYGAASRALDMAFSLGLDSIAERAIQADREDWGRGWFESSLGSMRLVRRKMPNKLTTR